MILVTVIAFDTEEARDKGVMSEGTVVLETYSWKDFATLSTEGKYLGYFYGERALGNYDEAFILLGGDPYALMSF